MTTDTSKRAEANRRNGRKSRGPRTAAGKERSRFNALKHGLSAKLEVLPGEDAEAFRARLDAWTADLQPRGEVERYLVERAVHVSWQLDRADRVQAAQVADARFAGVEKTGGVADEVAALGRRLFWDPRGPSCFYPQTEGTSGDPERFYWSNDIDDPNDPARIVNRLESSALGCAWLLDRWGELRTILEDGRKWQSPDRLRAVRLLGKQPLDAADDKQVMSIYQACWAMDPEGPHAFADVTSGLPANERERFLERLDGRGALSRNPAVPEAARSDLLALIVGEEDRLEELLAVHLEREESAGERLGFDDTDSGEWLRRYQLTFNRTLLRILETLRKRRQEAGGARDRGRGVGRRVDSVGRGSPDSAHRRTEGVPDDWLHLLESRLQPESAPGPPEGGTPAPADRVHLLEFRLQPESCVGSGSHDPTDRRTQADPDSIGNLTSTLAPPPAEEEDPSQVQNSKNEPTNEPEPQPDRQGGDPATFRSANSKNEPTAPAGPAGRRASEALAALFGLLRMVVAALFAPPAAVRKLPGSVSSVLGAPVPVLIAAATRFIPPSFALHRRADSAPPRLAVIPISDRARSSPS